MPTPVIIKLGGSLLSRSEQDIFNFGYLANLKKLLEMHEFKELKFFLAIGGGYTMRKYRDLARDAGVTNDLSIHWVGTTVNVLHAYLVSAFFYPIADEEVIKYEDYYSDKSFDITGKIKIGGGGRPGHSGDVDAILAAKKLGADSVISLKNVDGVYDSDPKINTGAKRLSKLSWDEYFQIINGKTQHEPGGNYPIDPIASKMAAEAKIKFYILSGDDLGNFAKFLKGEEYIGTEVA
jgi:uridylate kinase